MKYLYTVVSDGYGVPIETRRYKVTKTNKTSFIVKSVYECRTDEHLKHNRWSIIGRNWNSTDKAHCYTNPDGIYLRGMEMHHHLEAYWPGMPIPPKRRFAKSMNPFADWEQFGFDLPPSRMEFEQAYRKRAKELHPDHGGDVKVFQAMQAEAEKCRGAFSR